MNLTNNQLNNIRHLLWHERFPSRLCGAAGCVADSKLATKLLGQLISYPKCLELGLYVLAKGEQEENKLHSQAGRCRRTFCEVVKTTNMSLVP